MRIVPLYYLTILIYLPFSYVITPGNFAAHAVFLAGAGHLWTIGAELQFYLLLPLIVWLWSALACRARLFGTGVLFVLWLASLIAFPAAAFPISSHSVLPYLNVFLAGVIAAVLYRSKMPHLPRIWLTTAIAALMVIVVTTPSVWSLVAGPTDVDAFYRSQALFGVVAAGLILAVAKASEGLPGRIFGNRVLRKLGQVSFSGYLIHPLVLHLTSGFSEYIGTFAAVTLSGFAIFAAAWLLFTLVEAPLMGIRLNTARPTTLRTSQ